ncbi:MAG TPA: ETX/MTX2 family pore-forming toxin [Ktedonobacteraceae bacterium]|nr:ETX/MTX2 family pore-forming toxin [Ktedonobacteraceae bacterium]
MTEVAQRPSGATTSIVDLDAHIRQLTKEYILASYPGNDDVRNIQINYFDVRFNSQINYLLDQLNPGEQMDTIDQLEQSNNTSQTQPMQIRRSESVTNSYSWSSTNGFRVGVSVSTKIKVPFIGGIDTTVETEYSYSSTETQTEERTRTWDFTQTVNVAPYTKVIALLMLQKTQPRIPYELTCSMTENLSINADVYKNGQKQFAVWYAPSVAWIIFKKPLTGFSYNGNTAYFKGSGVFTANEGIKAIIDLKEYPLNQPERASKHEVIDVTPGMNPEFKVLK